jgi:hypothetical protein
MMRSPVVRVNPVRVSRPARYPEASAATERRIRRRPPADGGNGLCRRFFFDRSGVSTYRAGASGHRWEILGRCDAAHSQLEHMFDRLRDMGESTTDQLIQDLDVLHARVSGAQRRIFTLIVEADRRQAWRDSGARDLTHWISIRYGIS